ncbi:E3 ubiquitin-protein ligase RING1-like [Salvia splendens]|uniref:E3 ubiquitin-protein ligase RING1-like n=1 Tax=Salvia splendens TaxID=180675 RepID=UPI001C2628C3|nr:E3 ubiquitin-protein ligase RING1-like [Salvia splendens]
MDLKLSDENAGTFQWNSDDRSQLVIQAHIGELEESYVGNSGDDLDARGFEDLLDHLAENNQSSRRGAPPASLSFINNLPCLTINGDKQQQECAICKDSFTLGTRINELPCLHLYHPSCILPWLAARNTCPLCRYELPTDDKERNENQLIYDSDAGCEATLSLSPSLAAPPSSSAIVSLIRR